MEFLSNIFLQVWDRSYQTILVIIVVLLLRTLFNKIDKRITILFWFIPFFRLGFPIRLKSYFSLLPKTKTFTYSEIVNSTEGITVAPQYSTSTFSYIATSDTAKQISNNALDVIGLLINIFSVIWIIGLAILLLYNIISIINLKKRLSTATKIDTNIFESNMIDSPFTIGFIKPKIYIPTNITEKEREIILSHELTHIKNYDYIIKPFLYLITLLHWFNPLVWLSYILYSKDMEMACDIRVLENANKDIKKDYSQTLLNFASKDKYLNKIPLAFSENSIKTRIKNVLSYKKTPIWITIICLIIFLVVSTSLISDKTDTSFKERFLSSDYILENKFKPVYDEEFIDFIIEEYKNNTKNMPSKLNNGVVFLTPNLVTNTLNKYSDEMSIIDMRDIYKDNQELRVSYRIYLDDYGSNLTFVEENYMIIEYISDELTGKSQELMIPKDMYDELLFTMMVRSYFEPSEIANLVLDGILTNQVSVNEVPINTTNYISFDFGGEGYYIYEKGGKYYCELPYVFIKELSKSTYETGLNYINEMHQLHKNGNDESVEYIIENNLKKIMSYPKTSSNPYDYIKNSDEYEYLLKQSYIYGDAFVEHLINELETANTDGLREEIIKILCAEILAERNNVKKYDQLLPSEFIEQLDIVEMKKPPKFTMKADNEILQMAYDALSTQIPYKNEVEIYSPLIFDSFEHEGKFKIISLTYSNNFKYLGDRLVESGGSHIPMAIIYEIDDNGRYVFEKIINAKDGSYYFSSIEEFCYPKTNLAKEVGDTQKHIKKQEKNMIDNIKYYNDYYNLGIKYIEKFNGDKEYLYK